MKSYKLENNTCRRAHFIEINQVGFAVETKKKMIIPKKTTAHILVQSKFPRNSWQYVNSCAQFCKVACNTGQFRLETLDRTCKTFFCT